MLSAKAFVKLVLFVSWLSIVEPDKELVFLELFAGTARLTKLAKALGFAAEGHDITYDKHPEKHGGNNAMDITGDAGYLLLVWNLSLPMGLFVSQFFS